MKLILNGNVTILATGYIHRGGMVEYELLKVEDRINVRIESSDLVSTHFILSIMKKILDKPEAMVYIYDLDSSSVKLNVEGRRTFHLKRKEWQI